MGGIDCQLICLLTYMLLMYTLLLPERTRIFLIKEHQSLIDNIIDYINRKYELFHFLLALAHVVIFICLKFKNVLLSLDYLKEGNEFGALEVKQMVQQRA